MLKTRHLNPMALPLALIVISLSTSVARAGTLYTCSVEYGETVPIRRLVLKKGAQCSECEVPGAKVPAAILDPSRSREWNTGIESSTAFKSKTKRRVYKNKDLSVYLDTRYTQRQGPSFDFELSCPVSKSAKCEGSFKNAKNPTSIEFETELFDSRIKGNKGRVEITLGNREHLGFIARVFKLAVPLSDEKTIAVSASGEMKFHREDPLFILDAGADEQIELSEDFRTRIAAFEIKIRCAPKAKSTGPVRGESEAT